MATSDGVYEMIKNCSVPAFANFKIILMNMCFVFSNSVQTSMILKDNFYKSGTVNSFLTDGQIWT